MQSPGFALAFLTVPLVVHGNSEGEHLDPAHPFSNLPSLAAPPSPFKALPLGGFFRGGDIGVLGRRGGSVLASSGLSPTPHSRTLTGMELREDPNGCPSSQSPVHCPQAPGATTPRTQNVVRTECRVGLCGISLCPVATRQSGAA